MWDDFDNKEPDFVEALNKLPQEDKRRYMEQIAKMQDEVKRMESSAIIQAKQEECSKFYEYLLEQEKAKLGGFELNNNQKARLWVQARQRFSLPVD